MKKTIINFLIISIILLMSRTDVFAQDVNTKCDEVSLAPKDILTQINEIEANITNSEAHIQTLKDEISTKSNEVSKLKAELETYKNSMKLKSHFNENSTKIMLEAALKLNNTKPNDYYLLRSASTDYICLSEQISSITKAETEISFKTQQLANLEFSVNKQKNELQECKAELGFAIINYAEQFVGNPYVWGGNSLTDGIDCSHFVYQVLKNCGVYHESYVTSAGWRTKGSTVSCLAEAKAGDIICYSGHVAIYDGNGGIIEAKGSKWGITHDRQADSSKILTIRRFI